MKTTIKILLSAAIVALAYFCYMSIMTPIKFENEKARRDKDVVQHLIDLRSAMTEYKDQKGQFTAGLDTILTFLKTGQKKMVLKQGSLSDKQLEAGLTEKKAVEIIKKGNAQEIAENGLEGFRRDTAFVNLIDALYAGRYTPETIDELITIPYSNGVQFEVNVNNWYFGANNILIPLMEVKAPFETYLDEVNHQETLNLIDLQKKLNKYPGMKVGSIEEPNNNAGNWE